MPTLFPHPSDRLLAAGWGVCLWGLLLAGGVRAEDYRQGFDDETPNWTVGYDKKQVQILKHAGQTEKRLMGERSEAILLESRTPGAEFQLEHELPAARSIEELKLQVWMRANSPGAGLLVAAGVPQRNRSRAPGRCSPRFCEATPIARPAIGKNWSAAPQRKCCKNASANLRAALNNPNLDFRDAYVDRAILTAKLPEGKVEILLDELKLGPGRQPRRRRFAHQTRRGASQP